MPYCVNCGVELKASTPACPLCGTKVVLPPELRKPEIIEVQPQQRDVVASTFDKTLWIQVVSVVVIIPALLSIVTNAVFGDGLTWSLYVLASLGTVWVWSISPFLFRRNLVPLWLIIDGMALLGLLYVVNALPPASSWFLPLALPITFSLTLFVTAIVTLRHRRLLRVLHVVAATLVALAALAIIVESAVDHYVNGQILLQWSLLVVATCLPLALVAIILQRRQAIIEGMKFWFRI